MLQQQVKQGFDNIDAVDDEIRGIVASQLPHLLSKLPPSEDEKGSPLGAASLLLLRNSSPRP